MARRLRARIPRPPVVPSASEPGSGSQVPSAPYAVPEADAAHRPFSARTEPPWRERDSRDVLPLSAPSTPAPSVPAPRPARNRKTRSSGPWREPAGPGPGTHPPARSQGASEEGRATTPEPPEGTRDPSRPTRRPERPPAGYVELSPEESLSALERVTRGWSSQSALSRRSVAVLLALGVAAVVAAFLMSRESPQEVTAPELVTQAVTEGSFADDVPGSADTSTDAPPDVEPEEDVVVHVGGEVTEPGLYTLPAGSRVADAVEEAGGALPETDLDLLNLARTLTDGERILVGVAEEEGVENAGVPGGGTSLVNISTAGETELRTLPGIGEKKARQILAHREALGGSFSSVDDLLGVDGIGEKTLENLRPHVTVG